MLYVCARVGCACTPLLVVVVPCLRGLARFWLVLCLGLLLPVRRSSCILNATNCLALMRSALLPRHMCDAIIASHSSHTQHLTNKLHVEKSCTRHRHVECSSASPFPGNGASLPNCRKEGKYPTPRFLDEHSLLLRHGIRLPADEPNAAAAAA
ncbi:hypothetical protein IWZ03DRAFT_139075 [Phyllosticta citriasiana]|uniref:Secreted protein n=1 Tax=Phyllosticta citriasiana TaxID=595635 RepID=A0ABR1KWY8_9PEZI